MILRALKYSRFIGEPKEWHIVGNNEDYTYFTNINLFVGKNAAGKSRTLDVIKEIAHLLSGKVSASKSTYASQKFDLVFEDKGNHNEKLKGVKYHYILEIKDKKVVFESLDMNNELWFERKGLSVTFSQMPQIDITSLNDVTLMATNKEAKDIQGFPHFLVWGNSLRNYLFADQFEKRALIEDLNSMEDPENNREITGALLFTFYMGKEEFGDVFIDEVKQCMHDLGYSEVSNIDILQVTGGYCLGVEEDEKYMVSQRQMSQGMFRALSMFIFIIYARLKKVSACVLIDDVGEGVDFDRSKKMVNLIIEKLTNSSIQCFMSTNDRYVMNDIPLRFWTVIDRYHDKSILYCADNAKDVFEDFKYTGLNNYEFLTTNFYKEGFGTDEEDNDEDDF